MTFMSLFIKRGALCAFLLLALNVQVCDATPSSVTTQQHTLKKKHAQSTSKATSKTTSKTSSHKTHHTVTNTKYQAKQKLPEKKAYFSAPALPPQLSRAAIPTAIQPYQDSVCHDAKAEIGTPYIWGGTSPNGFDCSGFSQYVYKEQGIKIPRTAAEQFASLSPVQNLQPGDLVFFRLNGRNISHVGIYIGDDEFIHSPATGQSIRIDSLSSAYWKAHYAGARRALTWNNLAERVRDKAQELVGNDDGDELESAESADPDKSESAATVYPAEAKT